MFDLARIIALTWALVAAGWGRAWLEASALMILAYLLGLEVTSGITARGHGPLVPMLGLLLVLVGPSAMPRGPLPGLPLASAVVVTPLFVDAAAAVTLFALTWRTDRRIARAPEYSASYVPARRLSLSLLLLAVLQACFAIARLLPLVAAGELGDGRRDAKCEKQEWVSCLEGLDAVQGFDAKEDREAMVQLLRHRSLRPCRIDRDRDRDRLQ